DPVVGFLRGGPHLPPRKAAPPMFTERAYVGRDHLRDRRLAGIEVVAYRGGSGRPADGDLPASTCRWGSARSGASLESQGPVSSIPLSRGPGRTRHRRVCRISWRFIR